MMVGEAMPPGPPYSYAYVIHSECLAARIMNRKIAWLVALQPPTTVICFDLNSNIALSFAIFMLKP